MSVEPLAVPFDVFCNTPARYNRNLPAEKLVELQVNVTVRGAAPLLGDALRLAVGVTITVVV